MVSVEAWSPNVIEVPAKSARFVTVNDASSASVIAPVESKSRLNAVLVPARAVAEFSPIDTTPALLKVSVPALKVSFIVTVPPVRSARPVIETVPLSVSAPPAFTVTAAVVIVPKSIASVSL